MTKDQEFKQEFFTLLRKYNAEMSVRLHSKGTSDLVDGVSFTFDRLALLETKPNDLDFTHYENGKEFI